MQSKGMQANPLYKGLLETILLVLADCSPGQCLSGFDLSSRQFRVEASSEGLSWCHKDVQKIDTVCASV